MNFIDVVLIVSLVSLVLFFGSIIFYDFDELFVVCVSLCCLSSTFLLMIIAHRFFVAINPLNSLQVFEEKNQQYISELNFRKTQPQKIKVGDVVRFKDNPVEMNVVQVDPFDYIVKDFEQRMDITNYRIVISENVVVKYFDNRNVLHTATFKEDDLIVVKKEN